MERVWGPGRGDGGMEGVGDQACNRGAGTAWGWMCPDASRLLEHLEKITGPDRHLRSVGLIGRQRKRAHEQGDER